jgi:dihydrofolate reductase
MTISLIVAVSENNVIGKNNKLPWHLPVDLKYFKNITWAMPVVMGRKTFESMGKPLTGRTNLVVTRNKDWKAEGAQPVKSIDEAIIVATELDAKEIYVIGGAEIFQSALPSADKIYLTLVHENFDGDVFFPEMKQDDWKLVSNRDHEADDKNPYALSFQVWEKRPSSPKEE